MFLLKALNKYLVALVLLPAAGLGVVAELWAPEQKYKYLKKSEIFFMQSGKFRCKTRIVSKEHKKVYLSNRTFRVIYGSLSPPNPLVLQYN